MPTTPTTASPNAPDIGRIADLYEERRHRLDPRLAAFHEGRRPYLILQQPESRIWSECNDLETIWRSNLDCFDRWVRADFTDDLPYLEPWVGVGVFANAFGCEYLWRTGEAPATHYRYRRIEEVRGLETPDWRRSPVMNMVLDAIDCLKECSRGRLPIALTDTQSPSDTATLILDACEFFAACYTKPELVGGFLDRITDLLIEFTHVQIARIGEEQLARPGHIMVSSRHGRGISISDDNLAVASPKVNRIASLPYSARIAAAFGGLSVHSCGNWGHSMAMLKEIPGLYMIDCAAVKKDVDPNPSSPEAIRDAFRGSGIIAKVRVGGNLEAVPAILDRLFAPDLKLVIQIPRDEANAERNYRLVEAKLAALYGA